MSRLSRADAIRVIAKAIDLDGPYWDQLVGDCTSGQGVDRPVLHDLLSAMGVTANEYYDAVGSHALDWCGDGHPGETLLSVKELRDRVGGTHGTVTHETVAQWCLLVASSRPITSYARQMLQRLQMTEQAGKLSQLGCNYLHICFGRKPDPLQAALNRKVDKTV